METTKTYMKKSLKQQSSAFTLICYFISDEHGRKYTPDEISTNKNRRYFHSNMQDRHKFTFKINHQNSYQRMIQLIQQYNDKCYSQILVENFTDFRLKKLTKLGVQTSREPVFIDINGHGENSGRYFVGLDGQISITDNLINEYLNKRLMLNI